MVIRFADNTSDCGSFRYNKCLSSGERSINCRICSCFQQIRQPFTCILVKSGVNITLELWGFARVIYVNFLSLNTIFASASNLIVMCRVFQEFLPHPCGLCCWKCCLVKHPYSCFMYFQNYFSSYTMLQSAKPILALQNVKQRRTAQYCSTPQIVCTVQPRANQGSCIKQHFLKPIVKRSLPQLHATIWWEQQCAILKPARRWLQQERPCPAPNMKGVEAKQVLLLALVFCTRNRHTASAVFLGAAYLLGNQFNSQFPGLSYQSTAIKKKC